MSCDLPCGEVLTRINPVTGKTEYVRRSVWQEIRDRDISKKNPLPLPEKDERVPWKPGMPSINDVLDEVLNDWPVLPEVTDRPMPKKRPDRTEDRPASAVGHPYPGPTSRA